MASDPSQDQKLAVLHERLVVGKSVEEVGAVRVRIEVESAQESVVVEHSADQVTVERIPIDREVEATQPPWMDGDTLVVPVYARVPVVHHRLVLVEELRLVRQALRSEATATVPVQRERAVVERRQADGSWQVADTAPPP